MENKERVITIAQRKCHLFLPTSMFLRALRSPQWFWAENRSERSKQEAQVRIKFGNWVNILRTIQISWSLCRHSDRLWPGDRTGKNLILSRLAE